jgi:hypothetical protein
MVPRHGSPVNGQVLVGCGEQLNRWARETQTEVGVAGPYRESARAGWF